MQNAFNIMFYYDDKYWRNIYYFNYYFNYKPTIISIIAFIYSFEKNWKMQFISWIVLVTVSQNLILQFMIYIILHIS